MSDTLPPPGARSIDEVPARARAGLVRLPPAEAHAAAAAEAVLVDIRPAAQRAAEGEVRPGGRAQRPGWRFDPQSDARLPVAAYDLQVVVLCSVGYTSSLAAAALQELAIARATDVDGGFRAWCEAWCEAGLPTTASRGPAGAAAAGS